MADKIEKIHSESPDKGYRRLNDDLRHDHGIYVNDKRVLRICRAKDIRSTVKYNNRGCTRRAKNPQYLAENLLNRQFYAEKPNEKWLTDVTEFKWYDGMEVHKLYLSAILDLCDRRIVSYVISERNDNPLVYKTFDKAVKANPDAHPLFHSDRGFQYTSRSFHHKLVQAGMDALMKGRTTFVIAHRLSTVKNSDCIMVMEQGRIIERGTHDDLIEAKGKYYQLYTGNFAS